MQSLHAGYEPCPGVRLHQLLGKGSHGEVWEATQASGPSLAVKFISAECGLATPREIKAINIVRQKTHPHLIRIAQVWTMPGYLGVAMELGEGTLADFQSVYQAERGTSIPAKEVCSYLIQVAKALDFLNARQHHIDGQVIGIQHGMVKASNMLFFGDRIKLSDFELSSSTSVPVHFESQTGMMNYAAPEVFEGYLSLHSDQHALAVTYCELRGGRLPFPAVKAFRQSWPMKRPQPDLSMLSLPEQPIIARALQRVPQDRWPTCGVMMAALTKAVAANSA